MASGLLVPDVEAVRGTFEMLYGDEVEIDSADAPSVADTFCAVYLSREDQPIAVAMCDKAFGAYAGASLSRIPAAGAEDAAASGELSQGMMENLYEVMNICANLFMDDSTPHVRLGTLHAAPGEVAEAAKGLVESAEGPSFKVEIPRYGAGVITLRS